MLCGIRSSSHRVTTIIGVQGSSWAVMGADSQVSEESKKFRLPSSFSKLISNGEFLIGTAGDVRAVNILTHTFVPPIVGKIPDEGLDKFMVSRFVPALKVCFDNNFYGKDNEHDSVFIVAVRGVLYEVGGGYECIRDDTGLYSVGSGSSYALGALHVLNKKPRTLSGAKVMIKEALQAASRYDTGTSDPVTIIVQRY